MHTEIGPKAEMIGGKAWTGFVCCRTGTIGRWNTIMSTGSIKGGIS
jgi:hypothetical protein